MATPEQRRFPRKGISVQFTGKDTRGQGQMVFDGADLSKGGAFLKSELLLEQDEGMLVEFRIPGVPRPLKAQARVAWVRRFPAEGESAGMGMSFLAMTEDDRDVLEAYLNALR